MLIKIIGLLHVVRLHACIPMKKTVLLTMAVGLLALELTHQERQEKEAAQGPESDESIPVKKKPTSYKPKMRSLSRMVCAYCWSTTSVKWRKGKPASSIFSRNETVVVRPLDVP